MIASTNLPLKNTVLLTLEMVRAARDQHSRQVRQQIDEGKLQWVWNISAGNGRCSELRFWLREVLSPEQCIMLTPEQVAAQILGQERQWWNAADVERLLLCGKQHVYDLIRGPLKDAPNAKRKQMQVSRAALEQFFVKQLV